MASWQIPLVDLKAQYAAIREEILDAVHRVIDSTRFILGEEVALFEQEFANFCGSRHCVGVASGTAGLHLALLACGVGPGDEVITVPYTFIATVEPISYVGAKVVFVDIEPETYTMAVDRLERAITERTKAVIPVHLYGHPADMTRVVKIARNYGLKVIEDAAQAHGARWQGRCAGTFGDVGCFSFFPSKNLGAYGDAGAVITGDAMIAERIRLLRDHGRAAKYEHKMEGFNYRLDPLQAAILRVKLRYLPAWTEARRQRAVAYHNLLAGLPIALPKEAPAAYHVYHLFVIRSEQRERLHEHLRERSIETGIHYPLPLHLQPAYSRLGYRRDDFSVAEEVSRTVLSLPMSPELTGEQQRQVAARLREALA